MRLFDSTARRDDAIRRADEDTFAFLNRVDDVYFGRVRDLIEKWFAAVPTDEQPGLRGRLRAGAAENSDPAFWELYLRELLRRSGFAVIHEPERKHRRRPDFHVVGEATSFYLEARFVGADAATRGRDKLNDQIKDELNRVDSADFLLYFDIKRYGTRLPPLRRLRRDVEQWLRTLHYGAVAAAARQKAPLPERTFPSGEWLFWFEVIPRGPEARGRPTRAGAIGIGPVTRSGGSASQRLAAALAQKAGRYGDLDEPFVIALCCGEDFVDFDDIVDALYGEPAFAIADDGAATPFRLQNGIFSGRGHPRVSAVLTIRAMRPWLVHQAVPVLWPNPNAQLPLDVELQWAARGRLAEDGALVVDEPTLGVGDVLELPSEWPGPERPLRVRASAR